MPTPRPTPEQVNLVLYHRDLDGFASAWSAWHVLGDNAEYHSVQYHETEFPVDVTGKHVAVVDFSYKSEKMAELLEKAASVIVLDHHKTCQTEYPEGHPNIHLDLLKSGAILAFQWFHPNENWVPDALRMVQDYDLWQWKLTDTRAFVYGVGGIRYKSKNLAEFGKAISVSLNETIQAGRAICDYIDLQIESDVKKAILVEILPLGIKAWMYNGHVPWYSELGSAMVKKERVGAEGVDVALIWTCVHNGDFACSLRSAPNGTDVSTLASTLGGGGHPNAAGFTWKEDIKKLVRIIPRPPKATKLSGPPKT